MTAVWLEAGLAEFEKPPDDVFARLGFVPNPGPQTRFLALPDENIDVLYGGAAGGSKSTSLLLYALRACVRYPGLQAFWFRRSFPELRQSVLRMLGRYQHAKALGGKWNEGNFELRFANGSILTFSHAKNIQEAAAFLSAEINLLIIDERTTIPPGVVDMLYSRVRSGVAGVPCLGVRSATNPGSIGHGRIKAEYVKATQHGMTEITDRFNRRRLFIQARVTDTPQLGDEYRANLAGLDEKLRKAMEEGDWSTFEGQVFCYDSEVEILSGSGWKPIADVAVGEPVATCSPSGEMTFEPVTHAWQFDYNGDLLVHEGRALDFAVTPDHHMWTRRYKSGQEFHFVKARDLPAWSEHLRTAAVWHGKPVETVTIRAPHDEVAVSPGPGECKVCAGRPGDFLRQGMCQGCYRAWRRAGRPDDLQSFRRLRSNPVERFAKKKAHVFETGDWCELLGWYLSEGFLCKYPRSDRYAGRIRGFGISQSKNPQKIAAVGALLDRLGLKYTYGQGRFRVTSTVLGAYFAQFGNYHHKFIPREILDLPREHLLRLYGALMDGDGCLSRKEGAERKGTDAQLYCTTSRRLADDVQELCVRLGRTAVIATVERAPERHHTVYRVSVYQADHDRSTLRRDRIRREPYSGLVACVTVEPHHTVLVRRNGKAMWCGNSELTWDRHVVQPITLPASWVRYVGVDWGYTAPWAVGWFAVDEDGRVWIYREIYETQVGEEDQARRILAAESPDERIAVRYADDAMWAVRGSAKPIAEAYSGQGCYLTRAGKGPGSRIAGWQRIHTYLAEGPACRHHRALGWDSCPMLHVFSTCPKWFDELSELPHSTAGDPEDADTNAADHLADLTRYVLLNVGGGAAGWIEWARRQAELAEQAGSAAESSGHAIVPDAAVTPEPETPEQARQRARNAAMRELMRA